MSKIIYVFFGAVMLLLTLAPDLSAENYVNWKGDFWFSLPDDWEKVDYRLVDRFLAYTDTSRDIFNYEAVFAPSASQLFSEDAYLVVTFEPTGPLSQTEADSILEAIAYTYSESVYDAPIVQLMSDLVPGQPKINKAERSISVLSEMAYRPDAMKKLWLFMKLNDKGLISLYFYSPDSTYEKNKPTFNEIVESLSFENLDEASEEEQPVFTSIGGDSLDDPDLPAGGVAADETGTDADSGGVQSLILYAAVIIIVLGLIWILILAPRMRKKSTPSE